MTFHQELAEKAALLSHWNRAAALFILCSKAEPLAQLRLVLGMCNAWAAEVEAIQRRMEKEATA